jgi:hypothetical protein
MFIQVPVEIKVGCDVVGYLPARMFQGYPRVDMVYGTVEMIAKQGNDDRLMTTRCQMDDGTEKYFKIPDYRIQQYTFGGVLMNNNKFDQKRMEQEDRKRLSIKSTP